MLWQLAIYVLLCIILEGHWGVWCAVERTGNTDCNVSGSWVVQHVAIHVVNIICSKWMWNICKQFKSQTVITIGNQLLLAIYVRYCLKTTLLSLALYRLFSIRVDWATSCNLHKFSQFCALFSMVMIYKHRAQKHSHFVQAATGYSVDSNAAHLIECEWEQHCF